MADDASLSQFKRIAVELLAPPIQVCSLAGGACGELDGEVQLAAPIVQRPCPKCRAPGGLGYCPVCHSPGRDRSVTDWPACSESYRSVLWTEQPAAAARARAAAAAAKQAAAPLKSRAAAEQAAACAALGFAAAARAA